VNSRIAQIEHDARRQALVKSEFEKMVASGMEADAASERTGYDRWQGSAVDAREMQALAAAVATMHATAHKAVGDVDTTRLEFSGPGGGAIEVDHSIHAELTRDDPALLLALFQAAARATFGVDKPLEIEADSLDGDSVDN
jgi:hypothetical protein